MRTMTKKHDDMWWKLIKNNDEIMNNYENMMTCDETNKRQWQNNEQLYMWIYIYIWKPWWNMMKICSKHSPNRILKFPSPSKWQTLLPTSTLGSTMGFTPEKWNMLNPQKWESWDISEVMAIFERSWWTPGWIIGKFPSWKTDPTDGFWSKTVRFLGLWPSWWSDLRRQRKEWCNMM